MARKKKESPRYRSSLSFFEVPGADFDMNARFFICGIGHNRLEITGLLAGGMSKIDHWKQITTKKELLISWRNMSKIDHWKQITTIWLEYVYHLRMSKIDHWKQITTIIGSGHATRPMSKI